MNQRRAGEGHPGDDRATDAQPPVGVLIPPKNLARECHPQGAQEEQDAGDPRQLARILVSAPEKDLDHVERHHEDHGVRAPEMNGPQIPSKDGLVVQVHEALVRLVRRRNIDESETDPGDDLEHEEDHGGAAEHVGPARGAPRHPMLHGEREDPAEPRSLLEPAADRVEQGHHTGSDKVGIWPPRTQSSPSRIWYSYSNNPRGGGPDAREPSS